MKWCMPFGLVALVLCLGVTAPAHVVVPWMWPEADTVLSRLKGTYWSGSALLRSGRASGIQLRWHLIPESLITGCASFTVRIGSSGRSSVHQCMDGLELRGLSAAFPAQALAPVLGAPAGVVKGTVMLQSEELQFSEQEWSGEGLLIWNNAEAGIGKTVTLGSVVAQVRIRGRKAEFQIRNQDGRLAIVLDGGIDAVGNYRATGFLIVADKDPALLNELQLFGDRLADGRIAVRQSGRLSL